MDKKSVTDLMKKHFGKIYKIVIVEWQPKHSSHTIRYERITSTCDEGTERYIILGVDPYILDAPDDILRDILNSVFSRMIKGEDTRYSPSTEEWIRSQMKYLSR